MGMKILLLDDEELALRNLAYTTRRAVPGCELQLTTDPELALKYITSNPVDVIMADIEMPGMDGLEFLRRAEEIKPDINVIFVTAYSEYAVEAIRHRASGYLLKPARIDDITRELENLRHPIEKREESERLKAVCFGRFEVYSKGAAVHFARSAEKEILAYLINLRGGGANTSELCRILWEDSAEREKRRGYFRVLYNGLRKTLEGCGLGDVLVKRQNYFAVDPEKIDCDYYDFLEGRGDAIRKYHGQYMSQYRWAETMQEELTKKQLQASS